MPRKDPTLFVVLKDSVDRMIRLIDEFAKEAGEDRIEFLKYQVKMEERLGAINTEVAVSNTKLMIYGGIGGAIGGAILGAAVALFLRG